MKTYGKKYKSPKKQKSYIPNFLKIDFSRPLSFANQFTVMMVILTISCFLFTIVYFIQLSRGVIVVDGATVSTNSHSVKRDGNISNTSVDGYEEYESSGFIEDDENSEDKSDEKYNEISEVSEISHEEIEIKDDDTFTVSKSYYEIYNGFLTLVNKEHECHHYGEDVVSLLEVRSNTYDITDGSVCVDEGIVDNLNDMLDDFYYNCGESDIMIACGYRSYDLQAELYEEEIEERGDEEEAADWVAPPGYSEHQTGYVFDFDLNITDGKNGIDFDGTGIYSWIHENCADYGFILRYRDGKEDITGYSYEPWHFRYVGVPHSLYIEENDYTLEEYIEEVHKHDNSNALVINGNNGEKWCVYYVPVNENEYEETEIPVPEDSEYEISGDNFSGFIVTVKM